MFGIPGGGPRSIWHSYLVGFTMFGGFYSIASLVCAAIASAEISMPTLAGFPRTRPILRRFLFWGRIAPALVTLLGSFALAAGLSLLVLVLCHGPVYDHLSDPVHHSNMPLDRDATRNLALTLQTSAPRLFLSAGTTLLLNFSICVVGFSLPLRAPRIKTAALIAAMATGIIGLNILGLIHEAVPDPARFFFLYSHLGPPPPYGYAVVPMTVSIVLLVLASFFSNRIEI
jgi:hypothetical protein